MIHPTLTYAATALATACVCVPATVAVAPHVRHALHHVAPVRHVAAHHATPRPMRVVYMPCAVSPSASLGAAVERIQRALDETPAVSVAFSQTGSAPPTDAAPMLLYTPIWPVGPGPVVVLSPPVSRVPEPASWAMFIGGFGLVGAVMRRAPMNLALARKEAERG